MWRYAARYHKAPEGGYVAEITDAGGSGIYTQAESLEECREMARDAVTEVLLAQFETGQELTPSTSSLPDGWEWVYPYASAVSAIQVKQARKTAGMTVAEAAKACGVAGPTYVRWEDPYKSNITLKTLDRVAQAFGKHVHVSIA